MRTAVVVGAGIAGLATAGALARTGWKVTLLERDERLKPGRAALVLWPNGVRALRALGLASGLDSIATRVGPLGIRRPDGQWLLTPEQIQTTSEPPLVVHREDLHDALVAGLGDQVDVRTGVRVRTSRPVAQRPAVGDGEVTFEADLVVGADGVDSVVRRRLAPDSMFVTAGYAAWRALIPWFRVPQYPEGAPASCETMGIGHRFVYLPVGEPGGMGAAPSREGVYWAATAPGAPRPEPAETQLGLLRRWFTGWPSPIGDLLAATAPEDLVQHGVGELRALPPALAFDAGPGGYALVGDAGHAIAHYLGQGACLALEDAATLQAAVRTAVPGRTLNRALGEYSRLRRPRIARIVNQSRRVGGVMQGRGGLAARARNLAGGRSLPRLLERMTAETDDWRPPGE